MGYKVVFQITAVEQEVQQSMIRQLFNLLAYFKEESVEVEVVVHGNAWPLLLTGSRFADDLRHLQEQGVRWLLCGNTQKQQALSPAQLLPFVVIVPAGIGHVVERQAAGWAYIRSC
jgi:intracellular sulfur oxidation DsrE/DsrF family protein